MNEGKVNESKAKKSDSKPFGEVLGVPMDFLGHHLVDAGTTMVYVLGLIFLSSYFGVGIIMLTVVAIAVGLLFKGFGDYLNKRSDNATVDYRIGGALFGYKRSAVAA